MKNYIFSIIVLLFALGCDKLDKKLDPKYDCDKLLVIHKFIYEPIVISDDCNCIISGKVKYLKDCKTIALIDYGNGDCDNIATKIVCKNGSCFDKNKNPISSYEYTIDCNGNNINDGAVSQEELEDLNDPLTGPQP